MPAVQCTYTRWPLERRRLRTRTASGRAFAWSSRNQKKHQGYSSSLPFLLGKRGFLLTWSERLKSYVGMRTSTSPSSQAFSRTTGKSICSASKHACVCKLSSAVAPLCLAISSMSSDERGHDPMIMLSSIKLQLSVQRHWPLLSTMLMPDSAARLAQSALSASDALAVHATRRVPSVTALPLLSTQTQQVERNS